MKYWRRSTSNDLVDCVDVLSSVDDDGPALKKTVGHKRVGNIALSSVSDDSSCNGLGLSA